MRWPVSIPWLDWRAEHEKYSHSAPNAFASDESRRKKEEKKGEQKKKKRASHLLFLPLVPSPGTLHGGAGVRIDARSSSSSMCSLALYRRPYAMVFLFCFLRFFCLDLIEAKQSEAKRARERELTEMKKGRIIFFLAFETPSLQNQEENDHEPRRCPYPRARRCLAHRRRRCGRTPQRYAVDEVAKETRKPSAWGLEEQTKDCLNSPLTSLLEQFFFCLAARDRSRLQESGFGHTLGLPLLFLVRCGSG